MRTLIRRAAPSPRTTRTPDPTTFVEDTSDPVYLIEVCSDGSARRLQVTKTLLETYIEHDYQTQPTSNANLPQLPDHEKITLLCAHLLLVAVYRY